MPTYYPAGPYRDRPTTDQEPTITPAGAHRYSHPDLGPGQIAYFVPTGSTTRCS